MSPHSDNEIVTLNINTLVTITNIIRIVKYLIKNQNTAAQQTYKTKYTTIITRITQLQVIFDFLVIFIICITQLLTIKLHLLPFNFIKY